MEEIEKVRVATKEDIGRLEERIEILRKKMMLGMWIGG